VTGLRGGFIQQSHDSGGGGSGAVELGGGGGETGNGFEGGQRGEDNDGEVLGSEFAAGQGRHSEGEGGDDREADADLGDGGCQSRRLRRSV